MREVLKDLGARKNWEHDKSVYQSRYNAVMISTGWIDLIQVPRIRKYTAAQHATKTRWLVSQETLL